MAVHARSVVTKQRLRHERRRLAVLARGVLDDVLEYLQVVGRAQQRRITKINFALAGGGNFMMVTLDVDATLCRASARFQSECRSECPSEQPAHNLLSRECDARGWRPRFAVPRPVFQ